MTPTTVTAGTDSAPAAVAPDETATGVVVAKLIRYLETGTAPDGLFAANAFADVSLPQWRLQAATAHDLLAIRLRGHPWPGRVRVERLAGTARGFTVEFEERWNNEGQDWYCREMIRADVVDGSIVEMAVYCTGDWTEAQQAEHARSVHLLRP